MIEPGLRRLIDSAAGYVGLPVWRYQSWTFSPGELLEGLILTESAGNPRARRYEPHQDRAGRRDATSDADVPDRDDGDLEDDASYGLMQVMGYNARRLCQVPDGTRMGYAWLFLPMTNMSFGLRILMAEMDAVMERGLANIVERGLARYNGGPTGDDLVPAGEFGKAQDFRLRAYVNKVALNAATAQADRRRQGWK